MNFELFKSIICQNFKTATIKKFYDTSKETYYFTFSYLDFEKKFVIEESKIKDFSVEILAYHMKTIIEVEYVKHLEDSKNQVPCEVVVQLVEKAEEKKPEKKRKQRVKKEIIPDVEV